MYINKYKYLLLQGIYLIWRQCYKDNIKICKLLKKDNREFYVHSCFLKKEVAVLSIFLKKKMFFNYCTR